MGWFHSGLKNSLLSLLSSRPSAIALDMSEADIEDIRDSMLALLSGANDPRAQIVTRRVRYAGDVQALWFLRGDVMAVVAATRGETAARTQIERISGLFQGCLPEGMRSRPSPLSRHPEE